MVVATSPLPSPYPNPTFPLHTITSTSIAPSTAASNASVLAALDVNKLRIMHVANHIARHFQSGFRLDEKELLKLCFALARGIDYAVSHNDIAPIAHDLPVIIKKVYQHKDNSFLRVAIMVLLISVKNACGKKWFHTEDSAELMLMANEMSSSFCVSNKILLESSNALQVMLKVMPRYFPKLKLNHVIASFEVKAGYEILLADICIPRNRSLEEKIRLFVAQSDNISSSSCIISPCQVNFLVNGKGVERRTIVSMDNGPQLPTDITKMLKYGLNLFQVAGSFNGNYIIAISVMEDIASIDSSLLQDYVELDADVDMSDTEVIVGPSIISLICPISHKRIKTPAKGHHCRHHQCFDFDNYMEMNSKMPSWRCPHCNQSVSYMDIRIDQKMVEILADAGEGVSLVIISADGTWAAADENQNNAIQMLKQTHTGQCENKACTEPTGVVCDPNDIMDLTTDENCESDAVLSSGQLDSQIGCPIHEGSSSEIIDRKLFQGDNISGTFHPSLQVSGEIGSGSSSYGFTSGMLLSVSTSDHLLASPVNSFADASSLGVDWNRSWGARIPDLVAQSASQLRQAANNLRLQPQQQTSIIGNESPRLLIPRHVSRNPMAIQALSAMQNQNLSKRPRISEINTSLDTDSSFISPSQSVRISNAGSAGVASHPEHQSVIQPFSSHSCKFDFPVQYQVNSSTTLDQTRVTEHGGRFLQPHLNVQSPCQLSVHSHQTLNQLANQIRPPLQFPSPRVQQASQPVTAVASANSVSQPSNLSAVKRASTSLISRVHPGMPPPRVQQAFQPATAVASANSVGQLSNLSTVKRASTSLITRPHPGMPPPRAFMTTAPAHVTISRFGPSRSEQVQNVGGTQQTAKTSGGVPESPTDSNWRPTGRMRGSLTGDAYSAAISRYTAQTLQALTSLSSPTALSGVSRQATPDTENPVDETAG